MEKEYNFDNEIFGISIEAPETGFPALPSDSQLPLRQSEPRYLATELDQLGLYDISTVSDQFWHCDLFHETRRAMTSPHLLGLSWGLNFRLKTPFRASLV
jgi:hypothetical protein